MRHAAAVSWASAESRTIGAARWDLILVRMRSASTEPGRLWWHCAGPTRSWPPLRDLSPTVTQDQIPEEVSTLLPEPSAGAEEPRSATEPDLAEIEKFIDALLEGPPERVDSNVAAMVRRAMKARPRFLSALAMRALQLEQRLRQTQRELIRLQWELAQLRHRPTAQPTPNHSADD